LHLGDAVAWGASERDWQDFDQWFEPLARAGVRLRGVRGNHDVLGATSQARRLWDARFGDSGTRSWWSWTWQGLLVLGLDSELAEGSRDELEQRRWFAEQLDSPRRHPPAGVLVVSHRPPYTNSPLVEGSRPLREHYVAEFCRASSALLWLSGHAHGYERFEMGAAQGCPSGVGPLTFVVSAGGGGPRPDHLRSAQETGWVDVITEPAPRPWNFLVLEREGPALHLQSLGFDEPSAPLRLIDESRLALRGTGGVDAAR